MSVKYQVHIRNSGWGDIKQDGEVAGTIGQATPLEAYRIIDTGIPNLGIHAFAIRKFEV